MNINNKLTHEQFLKAMLANRRIELENAKIEYTVAIAEYNVKSSLLMDQISAIERQLDEAKTGIE